MGTSAAANIIPSLCSASQGSVEGMHNCSFELFHSSTGLRRYAVVVRCIFLKLVDTPANKLEEKCCPLLLSTHVVITYRMIKSVTSTVAALDYFPVVTSKHNFGLWRLSIKKIYC